MDQLVEAGEIAARLTQSGRTSIVHDWRHRFWLSRTTRSPSQWRPSRPAKCGPGQTSRSGRRRQGERP